jgi:hypothetical protein
VLHHRLADKETMANNERLTNGKTKAAIFLPKGKHRVIPSLVEKYSAIRSWASGGLIEAHHFSFAKK